ncbi:putative methyltransferase-domain-containing protein [Aspergillus avenaceus]|uniref:25S rRNA adenine-N(1) methyltransferase n=1 Tax=Aspergillus avenaceus TaxID=36643 RepID=A0A5N6TD54_ASPAV|nr:putative methyltransferase-domain-containing protein [Aspergillus avenaceus]
MVQKNHRAKRPKLLSHTRPPTISSKRAALSSKATRNFIRSHHRLLKKRAQAVRACDEASAKKLEAQIQANGGLESYQLASRLGQSLERGGDSSKVLMEWMSPQLLRMSDAHPKLRVLEVGALSTKNACSRNHYLDVTRIDLNSQEPGILKQDFMDMPLPRTAGDRFDVISLSLVLNYVPDAISRGEMLKRCAVFLRNPSSSLFMIPSLFLVLPVACIRNSRYLTEDRLEDMMLSLGFTLTKCKESSKLIFQLWQLGQDNGTKSFKKEILRPGRARNNFSIVLNQ